MAAATMIVAAHAVVLLAHEIAHRRLGVDLRLWQTAFAYAVIVAGPIAGVALARGRPRAGFALLALSMAAALLFTVYHHYVGVSADNVAHLPPGGARPLFRWTSALLAPLEAAGAWVGWRGWRASRTLAGDAVESHDTPTTPGKKSAQPMRDAATARDPDAAAARDPDAAAAQEPDAAAAQESLEEFLAGEITRMYDEVAEHPEGEFHFFHGREAAELFEYDAGALARAPAGSVASFAGVGNPHLRADLRPGETVLDLGSGAGLDALIAAEKVGPDGRVIGVDLNPTMCGRAKANAAETGAALECHEGRMEDIPLPDASVDVVISNGVINLSFRKRKVMEEMFRVLRPGGRISITDIVSAKQLTQAIVNDPKLWAS